MHIMPQVDITTYFSMVENIYISFFTIYFLCTVLYLSYTFMPIKSIIYTKTIALTEKFNLFCS